MVTSNFKEIYPYNYGHNVAFTGTYGKVQMRRYTKNSKMLKCYMDIMRYGPFSKFPILAELNFILKMWSVPSESLISRLNACTADRRGNLPFTPMRILGQF